MCYVKQRKKLGGKGFSATRQQCRNKMSAGDVPILLLTSPPDARRTPWPLPAPRRHILPSRWGWDRHLREWKMGGRGEGGREGGREPPCRDGRLVPWRILAAHPFRRSVVARALLLHPSVVSTAENASWHQDVSRRTPKGAIPRLSNCADGERQRREGLLALVRKRARLQEQEQPAGIFLLKTLKTFVGAGTCPIKIWEEDVQQSTAFTTWNRVSKRRDGCIGGRERERESA